MQRKAILLFIQTYKRNVQFGNVSPFHYRLEQATGIHQTFVQNFQHEKQGPRKKERKKEKATLQTTLQCKCHNSRHLSHFTICEMHACSLQRRSQTVERSSYFLGTRQLGRGLTPRSLPIITILNSPAVINYESNSSRKTQGRSRQRPSSVISQMPAQASAMQPS